MADDLGRIDPCAKLARRVVDVEAVLQHHSLAAVPFCVGVGDVVADNLNGCLAGKQGFFADVEQAGDTGHHNLPRTRAAVDGRLCQEPLAV